MINDNTWKNWLLGLLLGIPVIALLAWAIFIVLLGREPVKVIEGAIIYLVALAIFTAWLKTLRDKSSNLRLEPRYYIGLAVFMAVQTSSFFYVLYRISVFRASAAFSIILLSLVTVPLCFYVNYRRYLSRR